MFTCAVCGQPGACVSLTGSGEVTDEWFHSHCAPQHQDFGIEYERLQPSGSNKFSRRAWVSVQRMRPRSNLVFRLATPRVLLRPQKIRL